MSWTDWRASASIFVTLMIALLENFLGNPKALFWKVVLMLVIVTVGGLAMFWTAEEQYATNDLLEDIRGGDTFAYLEPTEPYQFEGGMQANTALEVKGKHPLHDVAVSIAAPSGRMQQLLYGTVREGQFGLMREAPYLKFVPDKAPQIFRIFVNGSNKTFYEEVRFEERNGKWYWALRVLKYEGQSQQQLYKASDPNLPKLADEVDWDKP